LMFMKPEMNLAVEVFCVYYVVPLKTRELAAELPLRSLINLFRVEYMPDVHSVNWTCSLDYSMRM